MQRHLKPWLVFAFQQASLFLTGMLFLRTVRWLSGHELHGARNAPTALEALGIMSMYAFHLAITVGIYRLARGPGAVPLGIAPSRRRALHFAAGTLLAFVIYALPWLGALAMGHARIRDTLASHWLPNYAMLVPFGLLMLVTNSVVEETTSRAFPMCLWSDRGWAFRVIVPALAFAALHLLGEPFRATSFLSRTSSGIVLGAAYALTGNIGLAAGIHTGMNYAIVVQDGRWHVGSLFTLEGEPWVSHAMMRTGSAIAVYAVCALWRKRPCSTQSVAPRRRRRDGSKLLVEPPKIGKADAKCRRRDVLAP